jgi:hypothetical protein
VPGDIIVEGGDEFVEAPENAAADSLFGDFGKPTFDLLEPRTARGSENGEDRAGAFSAARRPWGL